MKLAILFVTLALILLVESKYEIILDRSEIALGDKDKLFRRHTARIRKFNRTTAVLSGAYEILMDVDNSMIVSFEAFNLSGGQYKKLFGRTIGGTMDVVYAEHAKKDVKKFWDHTNISVPFGSPCVPAQVIQVNDWVPDGIGEYLPPYIPGNERWKLTVWLTKNEEVVGGMSYFAILRDNQKLVDSKW